MSSAGFLLVLAAAFSHATWNFLIKRIAAGPELIWLFSAVTVCLYLPLAVVIAILDGPPFAPSQIVAIVASAGLHLGYFLLLQRGYRAGDLSLIYPTARATGPVLTLAIAILILGETPGPRALLGAGAIIAGVVLLTGGGKGEAGTRPLTSLAFGLGAGTLIGGYTVWDAHAVSALAVPPLILDYASSVGRAIILAPVAARRADRVRALWRDHRVSVVLIAIFNPLAYILVLVALTFTPVTLVAPLREASVLITVILGSVVLGEGHLARRLGWGTVVLFGVVLIAIS